MGFDGTVETAESLESDGAADRARPDTELLVGITSGTTGEPKLFVRNQRSWATTLDRSDATFDIGSGDRVAVPGVLDHTHFLYGALHGLTCGATVDLRPVTHSLRDAATHLYSVPTIAWDVVRSEIGPVGSVREVLSSAARWPRTGRQALQEVLPNASLVHFYGASELSFVSFDRGGLGAADEHAVGELFDGVDAEIREGLVHVRSDMLFDGYLTEDGVVNGPADGWMTVGGPRPRGGQQPAVVRPGQRHGDPGGTQCGTRRHRGGVDRASRDLGGCVHRSTGQPDGRGTGRRDRGGRRRAEFHRDLAAPARHVTQPQHAGSGSRGRQLAAHTARQARSSGARRYPGSLSEPESRVARQISRLSRW